MNSSISISQWLQQLEAGDAAAMQRLWDHFYDRLVTAAETQLQEFAIHTCEGEDVAVSVFESVWEAAGAGRLRSIKSVDELMWMLLAMTHNKCVDYFRRNRAERRGGGQQPISLDGPGDLLTQIMSTEPDPYFVSALEDQFKKILEKLGDRSHQQIAVWKIEGLRHGEIAQRLQVAEATVRRKLKIIRRVFESELRHDEQST